MKANFKALLLIAILMLFQAGTCFAQVGFYVGTFDPPHAGHHALIERAIRELHLDTVIVSAVVNPTHKPKATSYPIRERMTEEAFSDIPQVRFLNARDLQVLKDKGVQSLQYKIASEHPKTTFYSIMGNDTADFLAKENGVTFPENFVVAVSDREIKEAPPAALKGVPVVVITPDQMGYSSSRMRTELAAGQSPAAVKPSILKMIHHYGLYGAKKIPLCPEVHL